MKTVLKFALQHLDMETAKQAVGRVFNRCGIEACDKHSLGFNCASCSRFVCNGHVYFRLAKPPVPICAACVLDSHPELLESD